MGESTQKAYDFAAFDLRVKPEEVAADPSLYNGIFEVTPTNRDFTPEFQRAIYAWEVATLMLPEEFRGIRYELQRMWENAHASRNGLPRDAYLKLLGLEARYAYKGAKGK